MKCHEFSFVLALPSVPSEFEVGTPDVAEGRFERKLHGYAAFY